MPDVQVSLTDAVEKVQIRSRKFPTPASSTDVGVIAAIN
jgi:hypothetical protein